MSTSVYRVDSCLLSTAVYHVSTAVYPVDSRHYTPQLHLALRGLTLTVLVRESRPPPTRPRPGALWPFQGIPAGGSTYSRILFCCQPSKFPGIFQWNMEYRLKRLERHTLLPCGRRSAGTTESRLASLCGIFGDCVHGKCERHALINYTTIDTRKQT